MILQNEYIYKLTQQAFISPAVSYFTYNILSFVFSLISFGTYICSSSPSVTLNSFSAAEYLLLAEQGDYLYFTEIHHDLIHTGFHLHSN